MVAQPEMEAASRQPALGEIPPWHQAPALTAASILSITGELMQAASHPAALHA